MSDARSAGGAARRPAPLTPLARPEQAAPQLPRPLTTLIGREREARDVAALLEREDVYLVTLTGPGGVGKTRLAIRVAEAGAPMFPDGVWFVPLAAARDPALVPSVIALALGVRESGGKPVEQGIAGFFGQRKALLVLDNFEHLLEAGPLVVDLLSTCPALRVLVTSRAALRVSGEHDMAVPPLALPEIDGTGLPDRLGEVAAVRLFVERAAAVRSGFALTAANALTIAAICRQLDGLPLAIELAAAHVRSLPPTSLLSRLDRRLPLLIGGPRDAPVRLKTMRGAIAWSHDLLPPAEQALFRRLAVFVGGFDLPAAQAVADVDGGTSDNVLERVAALVEQSLLQAEEGPDGEARYLMLETIREFAWERLAASGEAEAIRRRQALWCLPLADQAAAAFGSPAQARWFGRLNQEQANLRAALGWAVERRETETGLRLAEALWWLWHVQGHLREGQTWLETLLAQPGAAVQPSVRAKALIAVGRLAAERGDVALGRQSCTAALALARERDDRQVEASALLWLGHIALQLGELDEASACCRASERLCLELGDLRGAGGSAWALARVAHAQGDYAGAAAFWEREVARCRALGDRVATVWALRDLALIAHDRGDDQSVVETLQEAHTLLHSVGERGLALAECLAGLAGAVGALSRPRSAARLYGASAALHDAIGAAPLEPGRSERGTAGARASLGEEAFAAAWAAGLALSPAEIAAEVAAIDPTAPADSASEAVDPAAHFGLSPRELEVLRLIADGRTDQETAEILRVSRRTVHSHVASILNKLGVENRAAAVAVAVRHGLA